MAISGPASYVSTTQMFITHWAACDTELGLGNHVAVTGGVVQAGLQALLNDLSDRRTELQSDLTDEELAREDVEGRKTELLVRINQLNDRVRGVFAGSKFERALKLVPSSNDAQSKFTDPLDGTARLWFRLNADPATAAAVTLQGAFTQAQFVADIAALKAAYTTWTAAGVDAKITLEARDDIQDAIYAILKDYRNAMPSHFVTGNALIDSLPQLTPAPGSTPDAVTATFAWDEVQQKVKITFSLSAAADLFEYEIRFCAGPNYSTHLESVIGSVTAGSAREFFTDVGLANPGNIASFKVYVITTTGNEKGSNTLLVTRPMVVVPA